MSSLPIACTLSTSDLAAVKERYRVAAGQYRATARISGDSAAISLTGDKAELERLLTEMIARESDCCSFLDFDVRESAEGYDVRLRVLGAAGLEQDILREMVATLYPTATLMSP